MQVIFITVSSPDYWVLRAMYSLIAFRTCIYEEVFYTSIVKPLSWASCFQIFPHTLITSYFLLRKTPVAIDLSYHKLVFFRIIQVYFSQVYFKKDTFKGGT